MKKLVECFDYNKCDKGSLKHRYDRVYEPALEHLRDKEFNLLEVGVFKGHSLQSWLDYFPKATIYCTDIFVRVPAERITALNNPRVRWTKCDSTDPVAVKESYGNYESPFFDVIIDDGLHTFDAQRETFNNFFKYLKQDGVYFIEDVWPYHIMSQTQKSCDWIKRHPTDFSEAQYANFTKQLNSKGQVTYHDLRDGYDLDTFIVEVRPL